MKNTTPFQVITLGIFLLLAIIGIVFFALFRAESVPDDQVIVR